MEFLEMQQQQESQWAEAQKIVISHDLVAAAKHQLQFLAAIDRKPHLHDGPALERAICRYKNCWLPLLAKYARSQCPEFPLVVPLDCEWIWHCHRLNPVRYLADCEELFGMILGNENVLSSVEGSPKNQTEDIWKSIYPNEPYELELSVNQENDTENNLVASKSTNYDLVSAVKRQTHFYYQVSRPGVNDDLYLVGALERYKGFLYLIKTNQERKRMQFCVPTYDIDLIWHSHQLHPVSYSKDLEAILGSVLDHDDTDSDRNEGEKLDVGFRATTKQWEETFGTRYWRAGAMYRGCAPSPININIVPPKIESKKVATSIEDQNMIQLPKRRLVEGLVEIVGIRNLPVNHSGSLFVSLCHKQAGMLLKKPRELSISTEPGEKQLAAFQCEPSGELIFRLFATSPPNLSTGGSPKLLGTTSISLQDLLTPSSKLSIEKWVELMPTSGYAYACPQHISLRIAISITAPAPAPFVLHTVEAHPFSRNLFFPLPERVQQAQNWTSILDEAGSEVISIQMREPYTEGQKHVGDEKEVIGMTKSGETIVLAEFDGKQWLLMGSQWFFKLQNKEDHVILLAGSKKLAVFHGRKLGYEIKSHEWMDFMTVVEFTNENPHGTAVALLNLKSGYLKIEEQRLILPGITLAFILHEILKKGDYGDLTTKKYSPNTALGADIEMAAEAHCSVEWNGASACGGSGGCMGGCGGGGSCGGSCGGGGKCGGSCGGGGSCRNK